MDLTFGTSSSDLGLHLIQTWDYTSRHILVGDPFEDHGVTAWDETDGEIAWHDRKPRYIHCRGLHPNLHGYG